MLKNIKMKPKILITLDEQVRINAAKIAKEENRPFSNYIEYLLIREIQKKKAEGMIFDEYVPQGGIVVGKGKDESLAEQFEAITGAQL